MVDPSLMRGDDWVRCAICGTLHEHSPENGWQTLARDDEGELWDVCIGACGAESGIERQIATCTRCLGEIQYQDAPTGGWWIHAEHPADGHDAEV